MPGGGGLNCFPTASWPVGAIATCAVPQPASNSIIAPTHPSRIDPLSRAGLAVRRLAYLDPGLIERLGLVVGRIGAGDRDAPADPDGDGLLQPLLLEGIARHLVGEMARHHDGAVVV